jgi:hypothetical protein
VQPERFASLETLVVPDACYRGPNGGYSMCMGCGCVRTQPAKNRPNGNFNCSHSETYCRP